MKLLGNLLFWIVLALLGALAAQWLLSDPGYVLVRWRGYEYPTTVANAVGMVLVAFVVLALLWMLIALPLRAWRERSRHRSRARLGEGLDALHAGQYERAEKLLLKSADEDDSVAASARLAAARAAAHRGDTAAAQAHLAAIDDRHAVARAIATAEQALQEGRPTDALVALDAPAAQPLPPRGLALRAEALAASGQSNEAYGMLGTLRKQHALPGDRLEEAQVHWARNALHEAPDSNALADRWEALPKSLKQDPAVAAAYAERAHALGWDAAATKAIETSLDARWDEDLASRYGSLPPERAQDRQATLERWHKAHPGSPAVLLSLARSHREQGRIAESRDFIGRALAQGAGSPAWEALGDSYAAEGDDARARIAYANALRTSRGEPPVDLPQDAHAAPAAATAPEERDEHGVPRLRE